MVNAKSIIEIAILVKLSALVVFPSLLSLPVSILAPTVIAHKRMGGALEILMFLIELKFFMFPQVNCYATKIVV